MMWLLQISAPIPEGFTTTLGVWTITLSCHIKKPRERASDLPRKNTISAYISATGKDSGGREDAE